MSRTEDAITRDLLNPKADRRSAAHEFMRIPGIYRGLLDLADQNGGPGADAEGIVADVALKLDEFIKFDRLDDYHPGSLHAWLRVSVRRMAWRDAEKRGKVGKAVADMSRSGLVSGDSRGENGVDLGCLTQEDRDLIVLYGRETPTAVIAEQYGVTPKTIRLRIRAALGVLGGAL